MKKLFFLAATMCAAMAMNAAEPVVKELTDYANYIDFQALYNADPTLTTKTAEGSDAFVELPNGTKLYGYTKADGSIAKFQWNTKEKYNTMLPTPSWDGVDSVNVGTMWRADSGLKMVLGAFKTTADGKLRVFYQPNGDSERGVSISVYGGTPVEFKGSGAKLAGVRPAYVAEVDLEADSYDAGDVVITLISNTSNIFGVGIENLVGGSTNLETISPDDVKSNRMIVNGVMYVWDSAKQAWVNVLGF
ncbi:MAG: hypothetical protein MJZ64_01695 [Paludibacteraceae bacterium]|nr:hypothetical protein [Paludibacteraceae bacterium]